MIYQLIVQTLICHMYMTHDIRIIQSLYRQFLIQNASEHKTTAAYYNHCVLWNVICNLHMTYGSLNYKYVVWMYYYELFLTGIGTISFITVMSVHRSLILTRPHLSGKLISKPVILTMFFCAWSYTVVIVFPPIFGWGYFKQECLGLR